MTGNGSLHVFVVVEVPLHLSKLRVLEFEFFGTPSERRYFVSALESRFDRERASALRRPNDQDAHLFVLSGSVVKWPGLRAIVGKATTRGRPDRYRVGPPETFRCVSIVSFSEIIREGFEPSMSTVFERFAS